MDDLFTFGGVLITLDVLRNAVLKADRSISDFRIWRVGEHHMDVILPEGGKNALLTAARVAVEIALASRVAVKVAVHMAPLYSDETRKLWRIENRCTP